LKTDLSGEAISASAKPARNRRPRPAIRLQPGQYVEGDRSGNGERGAEGRSETKHAGSGARTQGGSVDGGAAVCKAWISSSRRSGTTLQRWL
jgi:hypothetical protein